LNYKSLPIGVMTLLITQTVLGDHHKQQNHQQNHQQDHQHKQQNHHLEEEIVVSAPFDQTIADTAWPVSLIKGERYRKAVTNSLGETLQNQPGIQSSSFGTGVGQVVIRGQSGNRVQILQNSTNTLDVSAVSPDHANGLEPMLATGIEVIRGPATLLYGNGAIGGIVNVIDERIPEASFNAPEFSLEQSHNAGNDENKSVGKLNFSTGPLNVHLDAFTRNNNDVEINGYAIDEQLLPDSNTDGFIANSDAEASGQTIGTSISGAWGFIGISHNELDNEYGLPPGAHEEEEEHGDEREDEHGEEQEFVRIDMSQTRYDLKGEFLLPDRFVEQLTGSINYTEYQHNELEVEPGGRSEIGTRFENKGLEARFTLTHALRNRWVGHWGMQVSDSQFSAQGEEAFIPETNRRNYALFGIERWDAGKTTLELGLRVERNELDPGGQCGRDETTSSFSASVLQDLGENTNLMVAVSRSQRAPTLEERYSNIQVATCAPDPSLLVLHAATALYEISPPDLDVETASNLEIGITRHGGSWTGELSLYYNRISDYIYLLENGIDSFERPIANYLAQDATFYGAEMQLSRILLETGKGSLEFRLQGDMTRASFDKGGDVPRLPPARLGGGLLFASNQWSLDLGLTHVFDQDHSAVGETDTDGHTLLELHADYHLTLGETELLMFVKGTNLLDEPIRNHLSFLKDFAPEAGRAIRLGVRFSY
tara:strand:- start:802 stop:2931 length:2130 start_codon:yes stop_codon:yes gene_type:complete